MLCKKLNICAGQERPQVLPLIPTVIVCYNHRNYCVTADVMCMKIYDLNDAIWSSKHTGWNILWIFSCSSPLQVCRFELVICAEEERLSSFSSLEWGVLLQSFLSIHYCVILWKSFESTTPACICWFANRKKYSFGNRWIPKTRLLFLTLHENNGEKLLLKNMKHVRTKLK